MTRDAYAYCERLAREHYENFPVASRLLPAAMRPHVAAIYAFARRADDFADEPGLPDADRLRLLDAWAMRLDRGLIPESRSTSARIGKCVGESADRPADDAPFQDRGLTPGAVAHNGRRTGAALTRAAGDDLIFCALENTIRTHNLPRSLFHDLLSAFRQDVVIRRYRTWEDVLEYCRRSANPVGRLVLRVAGYNSARLDAESDAVCTALQLTNFWQDLAIDWRRGRLYVPIDDRDRAGAEDADLDAGRMTAEWQAALRQVATRTRDLFAEGRGVCDGVAGRLRWELRLTWLGGSRILQKTEQAGFDVFNYRPKLTAGDAPAIMWAALRWKQAGAGAERMA